MTYVITDACVDVMDLSCVDVCPVDCIHPRADEADFAAVRQLFIDPRRCIDCDACREVCPVSAIHAEEDLPPDLIGAAALNAAHFKR